LTLHTAAAASHLDNVAELVAIRNDHGLDALWCMSACRNKFVGKASVRNDELEYINQGERVGDGDGISKRYRTKHRPNTHTHTHTHTHARARAQIYKTTPKQILVNTARTRDAHAGHTKDKERTTPQARR